MSNDTELKEKENVNEDVYDKDLLDQLLQDGDIDAFREEFLSMHNYEQSEYFEDTDEEKRQKIFEFLSPSEVADFFDHLDIDDEEYEELFDNINVRVIF